MEYRLDCIFLRSCSECAVKERSEDMVGWARYTSAAAMKALRGSRTGGERSQRWSRVSARREWRVDRIVLHSSSECAAKAKDEDMVALGR